MRSAVAALAWEFWSANRRGWLGLLAAIPVCALAYHILAGPLGQSDALRSMCYLPLVVSLILAAAFCNFTDRSRRNGMAGFPQHLFTLPVSTRFSVTCIMGCAVLSLVGIYIAWAKLVYEPVGIQVLIRWPATLIAAGVVSGQAAVWCLSGLRLTRIVVLSLLATTLVGLGLLPYMYSDTGDSQLERKLSAALILLSLLAYATALVTVGVQRRGGARGWTWVQTLADYLTIAIPRCQRALRSADAALFWIEWRGTGLVLPAAVMITMFLILGPVLWFTGRGEKETLWAETWLAIMPFLLAFPIGLGFGKPDFWSLDVNISPFVATRPITAGQLLAAKLKTAACSALVAWLIVVLVAPAFIYLFCDTKHWDHLWRSSGILYSPLSQWALPFLGLVAAVLITWSLLVRSLWLGYSGRPGFYYSFTGIGLTAFVAAFFFLVWWLDHPRSRGVTFVGMLPWLPWALAAAVTAKVWFATICARTLRRHRLISGRGVAMYAGVWLAATACLVLYAWLMAPRIEWFRNTMALVGLAAFPCVSIVLTPLSIAGNRHR